MKKSGYGHNYMYMKDIKRIYPVKQQKSDTAELIGIALALLVIIAFLIIALSVYTTPIKEAGDLVREKTKMSRLSLALEGKVLP